jgi:hypothetical protein
MQYVVVHQDRVELRLPESQRRLHLEQLAKAENSQYWFAVKTEGGWLGQDEEQKGQLKN